MRFSIVYFYKYLRVRMMAFSDEIKYHTNKIKSICLQMYFKMHDALKVYNALCT